MMKFFKYLAAALKWIVLAVLVFVMTLFFREQRLPSGLGEALLAKYTPTNFVAHCDSVAVGFRHGVTVRGFRLYDRGRENAVDPVVSAKSASIDYFRSQVVLDGLRLARLHDGYYRAGTVERDFRMVDEFPHLPPFTAVLLRPQVLGVAPERVTAAVTVSRRRIDLEDIRLVWQDLDRPMELKGFCWMDLHERRLKGEVEGLATQANIRPLLVALDVPVALPYMDAFTGVTEPVPAYCGWDVDLGKVGFTLKLDLHPTLGQYNSVSLRNADGMIEISAGTQDGSFNYRTTVGPIHAEDVRGRALDGTVVFAGTNGLVRVAAKATSDLPLTDTLRIVGLGNLDLGDRYGKAAADIEMWFPAGFEDYSQLNGRGRLTVRDGNLMQMKLFAGLTELLADKVPGIAAVVNQSQALCDFTIEDGMLRSDGIYIEGGVFSLKMYGAYSIPEDRLDFTVRIQFLRNESVLGKLVHPVTWPFTKLLLEFRLGGTADSPEWTYLSVIDRILEVVK